MGSCCDEFDNGRVAGGLEKVSDEKKLENLSQIKFKLNVSCFD